MNLLLRGFESKEVAENVAAEILKRGVCKSAKVAELRGDLDAAQQELATLEVTMSEAAGLLSDSSAPREAVATMLKRVIDDSRVMYERAMGDF